MRGIQPVAFGQMPLPSTHQTTPRSATLTKPAAPQDVIAFGAAKPKKRDLLKDYGINIRKVAVVSQSQYLGEDHLAEINRNKRKYIEKLIIAHEHAMKSKLMGGSMFSDRQYATNMEFELTVENRSKRFWTVGCNFEIDIENLLCGERSNLTMGFQQALGMLPFSRVQRLVRPDGRDPRDPNNIGQMLKVKRLLMTSSKALGEDRSAWQPCADCYAWNAWSFNPRFFEPETQVLSLKKEDGGDFSLEVRTLRDLLPLQRFQQISLTDQSSVRDLKIEYSDRAQEARSMSPIDDETVYTMVEQAQAEYEATKALNADYSGNHDAASALMHDSDDVFSAPRLEWVPRWPMPSDLNAAHKGITELLKQGHQNPTVKAIAYYSDHKMIPPIPSQGRLAQKRGGKDVYQIVIEDNVIQVRTIADYMPWVHGSVRKLSDNKRTV